MKHPHFSSPRHPQLHHAPPSLRRAEHLMLLCAGLTTIGGTVAWAQREPKPDEPTGFFFEVPPGEMPAEIGGEGIVMRARRITPEEQRRLAQEAQQLRRMTPAQRQEYFLSRMRHEREADLREMLGQILRESQLDEAGLQDDLVAFILAQSEARAPLREQRARLVTALRRGELGDEEARASLGAWKVATATASERYAAALKELDDKIGYSKKPRLEALLATLGLLEDAAAVASGPLAPGAMSLGQAPGARPTGLPFPPGR